ncbi:hypothetical protein [Falsirhodobacter deserti]|uniref:hypothetical protein n=1 Tax=Falsirhodobacter deserti TaxID=1365611 RepID=UPI000FE365D0|nr:hypothetical protein [Falsirhodobacter deserti]
METVKENAKLIPFVLEEIRQVVRENKEHRRHLDQQERRLDHIEERSERLGEVIKARPER